MDLNKSENAGIKIARVFADLEQKIIANRKRVFQNAKKSLLGFRVGVIQQIQDFKDANMSIFEKTFTETKNVLKEEIEKSVDAGIGAIDKTVKVYKEQGFKPKQEPQRNIAGELVDSFLLGGLIGFVSALSTASYKAEQDLLTITQLVNPNAENLDSEIDRVQMSFLQKGLTGKVLANGTEKEAVAQVEFLMRDESHKAILNAQGERARQYGITPLVQVSQHASSCPLCVPWQGEVLVDDVYQNGQPDGKHKLLSSAIAGGLGHFNCRHNWTTYVEGLTKPDLFEQEKVSKERVAMTYAIEQRQRQIERKIREYKRVEVGAMSEQERLRASQKIAEWQAQQRMLVKSAKAKDLPVYRQYSREQIGGETKPSLPIWNNRQ